MPGLVFRVVHIRHLNTCLSSIGSLRFGGRYNQPQAFESLYLADNPVTALLEVEALFKASTQLQCILKPPQLLISIEYKSSAVLDLTELNHQQILGTNLQELTGNWRLMNALGRVAPTQVLGEAVYNLQNVEAMKVPSARDPNVYNLVVFPDRLAGSSFLRVYDDSGTINTRLP
ncbi:MAG: RES family NAD+ phosphorylase [Cyanosarcina radialis HA8281-LM2]|jgi:RES domain-containing protein|nr:RES family NAD+ phosphorylase [Cyanosarcina radialis HA8281-LM2]